MTASEGPLRICMRRQHQIIAICTVTAVFGLYYMSQQGYTPSYLLNMHVSRKAEQGQGGKPGIKFSSSDRYMNIWPEFKIHLLDHNGFKKACLPPNTNFSIATLADLSKPWSEASLKSCRDLYERFSAIYTVEKRFGGVKMPSSFEPKVKGWLGNKESLYKEVFHQEIIHMVNMYTRETTVFNPLRDKRPVTKPKESEEDYIARITKESQATCDFCRYKQFTAEHTFGRLETALSFTASNVFKLDTLHAVVTMKGHDPLKWTFEEYMDMMMLTLKWLDKAHNSSSESMYPSIIWDLLPKSGSSQLHPHNQVFLSPNRYQGMVETWRRAAQDYFSDFGSNYFGDLVTLYSSLGLVASHKNAVALASLTPRKDNEVVIIAPEGSSKDFFELLYFVLRAFMDDMKKYSFSLGGGFPPMSSGAQTGRVPYFIRVITRGVTTEIRTDISALELFTATNVNIDPWKVIQAIRESIRTRAKSS